MSSASSSSGSRDRSVDPSVVTVRLRPGWQISQPPPLSVYVHLPWCVRKCPYCDFNSHEVGRMQPLAAAGRTIPLNEGPASSDLVDDELQSAYLDALEADLLVSLPLVWGRGVQTVFIGGGTPSLFSAASIDRLLSLLRAQLRLAPDAEITMEANPGTFEARRFRDYAAAGVTRLSLGVQSFDDSKLKALGRIHDAAQAHRAIDLASQVYPSFNIDLMYALPSQSAAEFSSDLAALLAHSPPHASCYHLTIEPNTLFARQPPPVPDDDQSAAMQQELEDRLAAAGLRRYEVSAFARPGHRARHNLNYWQFGDYLGLGAGAHGKLTFHDRIERTARYRHPKRYMEAAGAGDAVEQRNSLEARQLPFEFMLNALRLVDGVPSALFAERTGLSLAVVGHLLQRAAERGLLDPDPSVIRATPLGLRFLNDLQAMFL